MRKTLCVVAVAILAVCLVLLYRLDGNMLSDEQPIEITAEALWEEFVADRESAEKKFDSKPMLITGQVTEVTESFMGQPCVLLENGEDSIPDGIFCFFSAQDLDSVISITPGETITVLGTCSVAKHIAGDDTPFISIEDSSFRT